jgi:hypothetical protein
VTPQVYVYLCQGCHREQVTLHDGPMPLEWCQTCLWAALSAVVRFSPKLKTVLPQLAAIYQVT